LDEYFAMRKILLLLLLVPTVAWAQSRPIVPGDVGIQTPFGAVGNLLVAGPGTSQIQDTSAGGIARWGKIVTGTPTLANGELYYDNTGNYIERNAAFNVAVDWGALAPSGVTFSTYIYNSCQGDNTTFTGCGGMYIKTVDRSSVTASNKGVLYGLNVVLSPSFARSNSPYDDATGIVVSNSGTGAGTEALYFARNASLAAGDWGAPIGIDAWGTNGIYMTGTYTGYGITFAHGSSATLTTGVMLVPISGSNVTPIVTVGTNYFGTSGNLNVISADTTAQLFVHHGAYFDFGNSANYIYNRSNVGGTFPKTGQGLAIGSNFSNGSSEIAFFNTTSGPPDSFRFYQQTGTSAATLLLDIKSTGAVQMPVALTVATLPTCNAGARGTSAVVTDANAPTYNATVTGGSSTVIPVFCNGVNWTAH
jgi:hypothetical protein